MLLDLKYHDVIWFCAIREYLKFKERKGTAKGDPILDQLIHQGLIDWDVSDVSAALQQIFRYSACMAGRLTSHMYQLEELVRFPLNSVSSEVNHFSGQRFYGKI